MLYCDPKSGVCEIRNSQQEISPDENSLNETLLYFGDPMCSWCWGIAPEVDKVLEEISERYNFKLIMGGLRPGGGDPWNDRMKNYLREHWQHVIEKSGQPFSFELFKRESFNYNTEPPCRAVKAVQSMDEELGLPFYHKIQYRFYAENEDPGTIPFYEPVCKDLKINYDKFQELFVSDEIKRRTQKDFLFSQQMGIQGFPSLVLVLKNQLYYIARGYATFPQIMESINKAEREVTQTA